MRSDISLHRMSREERIACVRSECKLNDEEIELLNKILDKEISERLVENVIGCHSLPFGIAANFLINGKDYLIPMVIEESSVIAAASNGAKHARELGGFTASCSDFLTVGQIQLVGVKNPKIATKKIFAEESEIFKIANDAMPGIVERGGGMRKVETKIFKTSRGQHLVVYIYIDCCDAMGANTTNTVCEKLAPYLADLTGGQYRLRIISNFAAEKVVTASAKFKVDREIAEGILDAVALARADIRRAATHNKGIMNGIDAVALATGNDWRAIEAGAHAWAARNGKYQPLTSYKIENGNLVGKIEIPIQVGIAGGITNVHPTAKLALKILGVKSAKELAQVMACVGLANNFAALRALVSEGIQRGHMKLHAVNLAIAAGASPQQADAVAKQMVAEGKISAQRAREILQEQQKGF